jgi:hypothetical protein
VFWRQGLANLDLKPNSLNDCKIQNISVGFEILTAVVMKSTIFWDITPCSLLQVNRRSGGTYSLHFQGRKISQGSSAFRLLQDGFLLGLLFDTEDVFLRNVG